MYLIGEMCLNPNTKGNICLECGLCGRRFENGHIVGDKTCATCHFYDVGMSECKLLQVDSDKYENHNVAFVFRGHTCGQWRDSNGEDSLCDN